MKDHRYVFDGIWRSTGAAKSVLLAGLLVLFTGAACADVLPKSIQGLWAFEPEDCSNPRSEGLLKIEAKTVLFFASGYDVKRIVRRRDGSLRASGFVANEGEAGREPGSLTMKPISPDKLHVLDHIYHRCGKVDGAAQAKER